MTRVFLMTLFNLLLFSAVATSQVWQEYPDGQLFYPPITMQPCPNGVSFAFGSIPAQCYAVVYEDCLSRDEPGTVWLATDSPLLIQPHWPTQPCAIWGIQRFTWRDTWQVDERLLRFNPYWFLGDTYIGTQYAGHSLILDPYVE